jgi:hypothetical protein
MKKVYIAIATMIITGITQADLISYQAAQTNEATPSLWYTTAGTSNEGSAGGTYTLGAQISASASDYWGNANSAFGITNGATRGAAVSGGAGLFATGPQGTVTFLFKTPESFSGFTSLFNQGSGNSVGLEVGINSGTLRLGFENNGAKTANLGALTGDTWYYFAMTWDLDKASDDLTWFYGKAGDDVLNTGGLTITSSGAEANMYVGGRSTSTPFLGGYFQNIAVYETNLSNTAIQSQFNVIPKPVIGELLFLISGQPENKEEAWTEIIIINPYENIDWLSKNRYRANLHTHTLPSKRNPDDGVVIYSSGEIRNANGDLIREGEEKYDHKSPHPDFPRAKWPRIGGSDGRLSAFTVIDTYYRLGYSILALTDHNSVTWSWDYFGIDSEAYQMLPVMGCEPSFHHHIGSYFNDYSGADQRDSERDHRQLERSLAEIGTRGGLAVMFHPGRRDMRTGYVYTVDDYVDLFKRYDHLLGLEVYNSGDRYPGDRATWDGVLAEMMPDRPVWGFSNDDMHRVEQIARNWNMFLMDDLSEEALREAMVKGSFYFCYSKQKDGNVPEINSITVEDGTVTIDGSGYENIEWIFDAKVLQRGNNCSVADLPVDVNYIRARLVGIEGCTYTQPFGVIRNCFSNGTGTCPL